jgi:GT2 family glycosyltransferase
MSPRERFSLTQRAIDALYADASETFDFICVDGGSPASVRDYLRHEARQRGFRLIRTEHYLSPNEARNLALEHVQTPYVVFIDNDLVVAPGWLRRLVGCAEETGADIVGPLTCIGEPVHTRIHIAGGDARITEESGRRVFREKHLFENRKLAEVRGELRRGPTELIEFHCMLTRKSVLDRLGPFDEKLTALAEHTDFCLAVRQQGGIVMFEPSSVVTYVVGPRFTLSDLAYFHYRWRDEWTLASERHFHEKWGTVFNDDLQKYFVLPHRRRATPRLRKMALSLIGWNLSERAFDGFAGLMIRRAARHGRPTTSAPP